MVVGNLPPQVCVCRRALSLRLGRLCWLRRRHTGRALVTRLLFGLALGLCFLWERRDFTQGAEQL